MSVLNSAISQSTTSSWFSRSSHDSRSGSGRSQNHWKMFRKSVLAPHHIRIVDCVPTESVPESIVTWVEANRTNTERFEKQRKVFRKQVANGRGFGSSALFPQEVLPSNDARPFLERCMVPTLSAEALPEKVVGKAGAAIQKSNLSLPRPGLGCGFSSSAFAPEEVSCMPEYMRATGTTVHFDTGSISSGTALYCPFLSYERVFSQNEFGLEMAANQCAINGAWSVRALQMLFAKASGEDPDAQESFPSPISFSCALDNTVAVLNLHWVDHAQTYCMAPVVRFDLAKDEHFDQFLLWTEAIGQWALTHLLPEVKKAISLLSDYVAALPALVGSLKKLDPRKTNDQEGLVSALKLTYDNIPWRYDNEDCSPVSSSTASWGSPMINEAVFAKFEYPIVTQPALPKLPISLMTVPTETNSVRREVKNTGAIALIEAKVSRPSPTLIVPESTRPSPTLVVPDSSKQLIPGQYEENTDLVLKKRVGHAMDEISVLQAQIAHLKSELSGSTSCIQNELSGLRKTMTAVMRKEKMGKQHPRSPVSGGGSGPTFLSSEQRISLRKTVALVTTPTDPRARPVHWPGPSPKVRTPSGLHNCLSIDTDIETISASNSVHNSPYSAAPSAPVEDYRTPITIMSPTVINNNFFGAEAGEDEPSSLVRVSKNQHNVWSQVAATHLVSILVPATLLRVLLLGCLIDYAMMSMNGSGTPTITQYLAHVLETAVY